MGPSAALSSGSVAHGVAGGDRVEDLSGVAASHVVAVVASAGVVVADPGLHRGVEIGDPVDSASVEERPVELLQHGALHAFADAVVVRAARRDPVVGDPDLGEIAMQNVLFRLAANPGSVRWTGRGHGADSDTVLEELGYTAAEIADLRARQVV